jgi:hypothetical protein
MKMPAKQTPPMTPMKKPANQSQAAKLSKLLRQESAEHRKGSKDAC